MSIISALNNVKFIKINVNRKLDKEGKIIKILVWSVPNILSNK